MKIITKSAITIGVIAVIFTFLLCRPASAELKIGYVDFIKVFNNYEKTIQLEQELEKKREEKQQEREKLVDEIRKLKEEMELLSEEGRKKKQAEMNEKLKKLQEFDRQASKNLLKEKDDAAREIIEEFDALIKQIGKEDGYNFILNERFILYGEDQYDLTDRVLETLNKKYKSR